MIDQLPDEAVELIYMATLFFLMLFARRIKIYQTH